MFPIVAFILNASLPENIWFIFGKGQKKIKGKIKIWEYDIWKKQASLNILHLRLEMCFFELMYLPHPQHMEEQWVLWQITIQNKVENFFMAIWRQDNTGFQWSAWQNRNSNFSVWVGHRFMSQERWMETKTCIYTI